MYENNNLHPFIFTKKINNNYKSIPFNIVYNEVGKTKYLPAVSKEWKNSVYSYNNSNYNNIHYPIYDLNINSLIKGYFSLYFNHKFLGHKYISLKKKRKSYNRIFISKAEIKHTNEKAIITIYVFNRERLALKNKLLKLRDSFLKFRRNFILNSTLINKKPLLVSKEVYSNGSYWIEFLKIIVWMRKYISAIQFEKMDSKYNLRILQSIKRVKRLLSSIRRLRLRLNLNNSKFEDKFLFRLTQLIQKHYGKKVEFNIVNLKSLANNTDIFTEVLTLKLKRERSNPMKIMDSLLAKVLLPKVNRIMERGRVENQVDFRLVENRYKISNVSTIISKQENLKINKDNLNKLLSNEYNSTFSTVNNTKNMNLVNQRNAKLNKDLAINKAYYLKLRNIIFDSIKYKNMSGAKLVVKGRLTKRYRADRALYKFKWKGGLKNIDSAFRGLSSVVFRGYLDSNVEKSKFISKRRIGSFGVKSWISGK